LIASGEPDFPSGLAALDPPPPLISVLGQVGLFKRDMVAMVGARNASMLGMAPLSCHFPRRNRLISGMVRGVVVIEAAERSGSLITANYALEQGREVFAVPGSPLDPRARGANRLIREGAVLTESADDVLTVLRPILGQAFAEHGQHTAPPPVDSDVMDHEADKVRQQVEEKLGATPTEVDKIIRQCGAPPAAILTVLLELELAGRVQRHPGNRISWR
jgi:DNA processing protein